MVRARLGRPPQFAEILVFAYSAPRPLARVAPLLPLPRVREPASQRIYLFLYFKSLS